MSGRRYATVALVMWGVTLILQRVVDASTSGVVANVWVVAEVAWLAFWILRRRKTPGATVKRL